MNAHSKIGASSCERFWNCPGSVALLATLPPQPESPYAQEGTLAHSLAEKCLRNGTNPYDYLGSDIEIDEDMCEAVQVYVDTIREDIKRYKVDPKDLSIEHKFHLVDIDDDAYGTNDACLPVFLTKLIVYDYKHGKGVAVEAEENKQLMYYALGGAKFGDYTEIEMVIVQPRAPHKDGPIRRYTIPIEELKKFGEELKLRIANTRKKKAPLHSGPWCHKTFCSALSVCPAVKKDVMALAPGIFDDVQIELPKPESLTPVEIQRLLDSAELLDTWIRSIEVFAFQQANAGRKIEGYKLVRKRANRKWANPEKVIEAFELSHGQAIFEEPKLKSPAALEKVVGKKEVAALTVVPEAGLVLVREKDPREEVLPNAIGVFEEIK